MPSSEDKLESLLLDNRFVDWVLNPGSRYASYWESWSAEREENAELAASARAMVLEIGMEEEYGGEEMPAGEVDALFGKIREGIGERERHRMRPLRWTAIAAAIALLVAAGGWMLFRGEAKLKEVATVAEGRSPEVVRFNGNSGSQALFLPDGSRVVLGKGARIAYNLLMDGSKREVKLTGEAFFDVVPNPQQPFYIYTDKMVVKVLGTSFRVKASGAEESVAVSTGKVSVYLKGQDLEQRAASIVMPRQLCRYEAALQELVTEDFGGNFVQEAELAKLKTLVFEEAPVAEVLRALETHYAIPITFDADTFKNCYITLTLGNESLEEILKVITRTIDASYTMSTYGIRVEGNGCQNEQ
ncbi:FecR family protein [Chitinophaga caseinilytica]|uniref:FecR family protein n=1 Tax=Chitinophaga caseinilytica TaxID=2267521 RepID=A0ABZ2YWR1_9BACT